LIFGQPIFQLFFQGKGSQHSLQDFLDLPIKFLNLSLQPVKKGPKMSFAHVFQAAVTVTSPTPDLWF
jgi:hypothetical protein